MSFALSPSIVHLCGNLCSCIYSQVNCSINHSHMFFSGLVTHNHSSIHAAYSFAHWFTLWVPEWSSYSLTRPAAHCPTYSPPRDRIICGKGSAVHSSYWFLPLQVVAVNNSPGCSWRDWHADLQRNSLWNLCKIFGKFGSPEKCNFLKTVWKDLSRTDNFF